MGKKKGKRGINNTSYWEYEICSNPCCYFSFKGLDWFKFIVDAMYIIHYIYILIIIITQGVFLSLRRNPSLHALHNFLSFAMWLHVGPTYWIKLSHHLVLGRPRDLLFPRSIHSVTLIVHLLSRLLATWPTNLCFLSLMLLIMSITPLCFQIHSVLFLSLRVTPIMILSILIWVVTSVSSWVLLSDQVS